MFSSYHFHNDMKRIIWATIKEIIGSKKSSFIPKTIEIFDQKSIAENFNKVLSEVGLKLASKILHSLFSFERFLHGDYPSLEKKSVKENLETKKSSEYDKISSDVIKHILPLVFKPMKYIFNLSKGKKRIFPEQQNC